jgi:hypothetical protein
MTVPATPAFSEPVTVVNGVNTYTFDFDAYALQDVRVQVTDPAGNIDYLDYQTDYTVAFVPLPSYGGVVTITLPLTVGSQVVLFRDTGLAQATALPNQGPFFAKTVEKALDRLTMVTQDQAREVSLALSYPIGSTANNRFPEPVVGKAVVGRVVGGVAVYVADGPDVADLNAAVAATAADRVATGQDRAATAADRVQTGQDRVATGADKTATAADRVQTGLDTAATAADRVQTGLDTAATAADRVQTGLDAAATAADRVQTGQDRVATAADRVQTGLDAAATAADRVQTGQDRVAAAASAVEAAESAALVDPAAIAAELATKLNKDGSNVGDEVAQAAFRASIGAISEDDVPPIENLDADVITTGTFDAARIPNLDAGKITTGTLPVARGGTGQTTEAGMRGVYTGSSNSNANYPIGAIVQTIFAASTAYQVEANQTATGQLSILSGTFAITGSGTTLTGTWRSRGYSQLTVAGTIFYSAIFQRVA